MRSLKSCIFTLPFQIFYSRKTLGLNLPLAYDMSYFSPAILRWYLLDLLFPDFKTLQGTFNFRELMTHIIRLFDQFDLHTFLFYSLGFGVQTMRLIRK